MCWGIGIFLSSGVVRATLEIEGDWSTFIFIFRCFISLLNASTSGWRLPFVIQWVWPVPLMIGAYLAPESPWWLVRQGRHEDAEKTVLRLTNPELFTPEDAKRSVANMIHTTALERQVQDGTSYIQCFKGIDARRTEIVTCSPSQSITATYTSFLQAMMVFAAQLLSGQNLIGQGVQLYVVHS
jgi:SP family general alpha glucoside:H+ symporter-like MFS transporter